jgi:hypothetical protein
MTKVIEIGKNEEVKLGKKIEFLRFLNTDIEIVRWGYNPDPKSYDFIELICRDYHGTGNDLMFVFDNDTGGRRRGWLILGKFNDGVV